MVQLLGFSLLITGLLLGILCIAFLIQSGINTTALSGFAIFSILSMLAGVVIIVKTD